MLPVALLSISFSVPAVNYSWVDGGAKTACVDNTTGLLGPGASTQGVVSLDACKQTCTTVQGCMAVVYETYDDGSSPGCMRLFNSVASCMMATDDQNCWAPGGAFGAPGVSGVVGYKSVPFHSEDSFYSYACSYLHVPPPTEDKCAPVTAASATWDMVTAVGIAKDVSYSHGVSHSYTSGSSNSKTWGTSATHTVGGGFSFSGIGAHYDYSVTHSSSQTVSKFTSDTFTMTDTVTVTYHFEPGTLWQLKFNFTDKCGSSVARTGILTQTNNIDEPPCCLPNYFKDPKQPHGPCVADADGKTYDLCATSR